MTPSSSDVSRTEASIACTASGAAAALNGARKYSNGAVPGVEEKGSPVYARRDLLEQLKPFPGQAVFKLYEAGCIAAGPRQAVDEAVADRVNALSENDWHGARDLGQHQ